MARIHSNSGEANRISKDLADIQKAVDQLIELDFKRKAFFLKDYLRFYQRAFKQANVNLLLTPAVVSAIESGFNSRVKHQSN